MSPFSPFIGFPFHIFLFSIFLVVLFFTFLCSTFPSFFSFHVIFHISYFTAHIFNDSFFTCVTFLMPHWTCPLSYFIFQWIYFTCPNGNCALAEMGWGEEDKISCAHIFTESAPRPTQSKRPNVCLSMFGKPASRWTWDFWSKRTLLIWNTSRALLGFIVLVIFAFQNVLGFCI